MFEFLKRNYKLMAPVTGQIIDLSEVKDELFSKRMMGDGVAVEPTGDVVVAPASGVLTMIFPTNHAFGLKLRNGVEVLVHIGLDTVNLQGVGFERLTTLNRKVKAGEPIIRFNRKILQEHGC
jgi:glucose-specific phosphotransferase system IIA component